MPTRRNFAGDLVTSIPQKRQLPPHTQVLRMIYSGWAKGPAQQGFRDSSHTQKQKHREVSHTYTDEQRHTHTHTHGHTYT